MARGYRLETVEGLPVLVVRLTFPPRLDVEKMFNEIAVDCCDALSRTKRRMYRINDFSAYDHINIFSAVVRGLAAETQGRAGTNSDPRLYPIMVGKGSSVRLIVEALRQEQYGSWAVPSFFTREDALAAIGRWETGEDCRPCERLEGKVARELVYSAF
jgi:hypothetical protein